MLKISTTGAVSVNTNIIGNKIVKVKVTSSNGMSKETNLFTVIVVCGPSSNLVTPASTLTNSISWIITNSNPEFPIDPFSI